MSHLKDRVILITGAANGFGRMLATLAAQRGASIVGTDINAEELKATVENITNDGGKAIGVPADVTDKKDFSAVVSAAVDTFKQVDILVNSAGTMPLAFYAEHEQAGDAWSRCIDINIKGVLNGITAVYDQMIAQGRGHVVNLSSIYGNAPVPGGAVYGASKAAVNYLSDALRQESFGKIKVTTVRPTGVPDTGLNASVINPDAGANLLGLSAPIYMQKFMDLTEGKAPKEWSDADNIEYLVLSSQLLTEQILYAIDQPWGVSISDMTVRASGDMYAQ